MKVKVGDRVQIREWSDMKKEFGLNEYGHIDCHKTFVKEMRHLCGRVATVKSVWAGGWISLDFDDKSGGTVWNYSTDMLVKSESKRITIEVYGNKTVAKVYDGDEVVKVGVAKCSPDDAFDFATGARIAFDRIYGEKTKPKTLRDVVKEREPEKVCDCWNGGVKCCPADYPYLHDRADCVNNNCPRYPGGCNYSCYECWNRPYKPESKQKTMHIVHRDSYYGEVGKPTELKDINGEALFIGDVVEKFDCELTSHGTTYICNDKESGDFVMGIADSSGTKQNHGEIIGGWKIIKRKSHEKARVGDSVDGLKIVTESEVKNA